MEREKYITKSNENYTTFLFISEGVNGTIQKSVMYQHVGGDIYNLAFGDYNDSTGWLDDSSRSNNGDADKVLATVADTIITFLQIYPDAEIFVQGSSQSRTRLYQMQLAVHIKEISSRYIVEGIVEDEWEIFRKRKNYDSFSIRNKKIE